VAYLLSGMLLFGGAGWLVDRWLDTTVFVLIGLLAGTALAVYLVYVRLNV
jgi:F0F1-type ATP synthase assembly protein I